ncbi:hypothetical protein [Streptomyces gobiensis]|uniref:hypothetical protein n=1 Tax=Streptomyces gobiensis TaxID=2875706 RepID=UPI001E4D7991|nr:hypothetical protein [Streptomyces gobiensis]UGY91672.1 hypothetical protein test1122_07995 [Streptomyces gobiensis]
MTRPFLDVNGVDMADIDQDQAYGLVIDIASSKVEEVPVIADVLRALHARL